MREYIEIEDIEYLRRRNGIDDLKLQEDVRGLRVGNIVKLTFIAGPRATETLSVRITSIGSTVFRGKLTKAPTVPGLSKLRLESVIVFTADHIHSLVKAKSTP
jgi:hypothetical protein